MFDTSVNNFLDLEIVQIVRCRTEQPLCVARFAVDAASWGLINRWGFGTLCAAGALVPAIR